MQSRGRAAPDTRLRQGSRLQRSLRRSVASEPAGHLVTDQSRSDTWRAGFVQCPANPSNLRGQDRTDEDHQVDEADPRLIADVELFECHVPWVRKQYPAEKVDHSRR